MSIRNSDTIDEMGLTDDNMLVLFITDDVDWSDEEAHLRLLENKINAYFEFIQSGQAAEQYPDDEITSYAIKVEATFPPTGAAMGLFGKANEVAEQINTIIRVSC